MIHYTANTKYEVLRYEEADGTVHEVYRALNAVEVPGNSDPDQVIHRAEIRPSGYIYLDSEHRQIAAGLGQESTAPHLKPSKER